MIALAELCTEKLTLRQKILRPFSGDTGVDIYEEEILGMPVLRVRVRLPENPRGRTVEARLCRAMDALDRMRIKNVCYNDNFLYKSEFLQEKFGETGTENLWRLKAAEIAGKASDRRDSVFFAAGTLGPRERETAEELCLKFRNVAISSGENTARFCRRIFDRTGTSVISKSAPFGRIYADAAVLFSVPSEIECAGSCVVAGGTLPEGVYGFGKIVTEADFDVPEAPQTPEGYDRQRLLSAAYACGAVKGGEIAVGKTRTRVFSGEGVIGAMPGSGGQKDTGKP